MVPKNHACHTVAVGAPRAKNASRHSRVFWEFPSKCPERMVQWARFFCVLRHMRHLHRTPSSRKETFTIEIPTYFRVSVEWIP